MFSFFKTKPKSGSPIFLTNTLSGEKERFAPMRAGEVSMYSCGPTVYGPVQIGNLRSFILADIAARLFSQNGYRVRRVMNITDVGHLVADAEFGEDKMAVGAKRDNTTPKAIAERYSKKFLEDIQALNVDTSQTHFPKATDYIKEQIEMIKALEKKGYTYKTTDGVYFNAKKFPSYGELGGLKEVMIQSGKRVTEGKKRGKNDFVLWRTAKQNDLQQWDSPWGKGNPGWSIECSAMAISLLGPRIDVHTGGEDLASIHHNNEIAQSECATDMHPFVRYWLHGAFLTIGGEKLSKSAGNSFTLSDVRTENIHPLALRYLFMQAHYRTPLSFSFDALRASEEALFRLWKAASEIQKESKGKTAPSDAAERIKAFLRDDLGTPQALAALFDALQDEELSARQKWGVLEVAEEVLGVSLTNPPQISFALIEVHRDVQQLARERELARKEKDYTRADELRKRIEALGYQIEDKEDGPRFTKI
jgi:cysteinyl-tRNA synthetase